MISIFFWYPGKYRDEEVASRDMVNTREPTFWAVARGYTRVVPDRQALSDAASKVDSRPAGMGPSNEPTSRRAPWPRCAAGKRNANLCVQACKQLAWLRSYPLGPERHGGQVCRQVCRYAESLIQGRPGKGE